MRIVLHAHSNWSYDGSWTLPQIARLYGALGVQAVMMTEHDTGFDPDRFEDYRAACIASSTDRCRLVPGIEYSSPDNDIHILTWGLGTFLAEHRPTGETLEAVHAAGGAAIFAHPIRRNAWSKFDSRWVPYLSAIELWNRKSDGITISPTALELIRATRLPASVGQDFHKLRHVYPLTMQAPIPLGADDLEAALVKALRDGRMQPQAFRRPVLGPDGTPRVGVHDILEKGRRVARDLRDRIHRR